MSNHGMRFGVASKSLMLALLLLPAAIVQGAALPPPTFQISAITADDGPGIYNGSPVNINVTIRNASTYSGAWQAALSIPSGYSFVDGVSCGGAVTQPVLCRSKDYSGSSYYLLWPNGTDGMGSGNTLAGGASASCTVRLIAHTVTRQDIAYANVYDAPHYPCSGTATGSGNYTFTTTAVPTTDVSIAISPSSNSVTQGGTVDYTLTASNLGRQDASNVSTVFTFPAQLTVAPKNCPGASTLGGNSISWSLTTLAYGSSANCVLTATAVSGAGSNVTVSARTQLAPGATDTNTGNNSAASTIPVGLQPQADMSATITADKTQLAVGDTVTFSVKATNGGPQDATQTQITAVLPPPLSLISSNCITGTPQNPLILPLGTLPNGQTRSCSVVAKLGNTSLSSLTVSDSASSALADPNHANDGASLILTIAQNAPAPNLAIHLADAQPGHTYAIGEHLTLSATATNTTPALTSTGVVATVHVRNQADLNDLAANCGSFTADGKLTWNIGTLPGGASVTCSITATIAGGSRFIPVTAHIRDPALGADRSQLMDALLVPVNPAPKRISLTNNGTPTSGNSTHVVLSRDGQTAVFQSLEPKLVANNANSASEHVFRVGSDGVPVLETLDASGNQLPGNARRPALSGDGSLVAFNYAPPAPALAKDAILGAMWAGSAGQPKHQVDMPPGGGAPNGPAVGAPSVSSAGGVNKLAFCSGASNLVPNDTNGGNDVFVVDPTNPSKPPILVSTDSSGVQLAGNSCDPQLSADGTTVVFSVSDPTLFHTTARQVVRKNLVTGALDLVSVAPVPGGPGGNGDSTDPTVNADGSVVAFTSAASNLDTLGAPVGGNEVFVWQPASDGSHVLRRVRSSNGTVPNGSSQNARLSDDGSVLVMQTTATNFFGLGKADNGNAGCGSVAVTMNFFTPAAMGSALCNGSDSHQSPSISGDGSTVGFDSNAPQSGGNTGVSNVYTQTLSGSTALGKASFASDYSGQWYDPNQGGQGLVIDMLPAAPGSGDHLVSVIWFVYLNGQPTWLLGAGVPQAGTGADAGKTVLQMNQVGIYQGVSFPLGEPAATATLWGSIRIAFADSETASMSWTTTYPGFNPGTMALTHFLPVNLPASDAAGAQVKACYSGNWKEASKSGHGFEFEVVGSTPPLLAVDWFTYTPTGSPVWLQGAGPINGNSANLQLQVISGSGAQFPPLFDPTALTSQLWGTLGVTFSDATHAHATWTSSLPGYGSGAIDIVPTYGLDQRGCH